MSVHKLILLPANPEAGFDDCSELAAHLTAIGLIGSPAAYDGGMFYPTGSHFLQLVTFLGCSPTIELDPPAAADKLAAAVRTAGFCHVMLSCHAQIQFRADPRTRPPRCPHCRQPVPAWQDVIRQWRDDPAATAWSCTHCGHACSPTGWAFRKSAGFGKVFLEIRGIYPSEAVPGEPLMKQLGILTGCDWEYIYIKE